MGRKRKTTKAQMRIRYHDTTRRMGTIHHPYYDSNGVMPPYPFAPPPSYVANSSYHSYTAGRRLSASLACDLEDIKGIINDEIPAAVTKEEEDDPKSLDNKKLIANSEPSTELEVALKAELDKEVTQNKALKAELDKLRKVLSRIQAHQSNEPLPPHGSTLHTAQPRKDHEHKPPQSTKKGPRNGYNMFYAKVAPELKGSLNSYKELAKVISEKWKALSKEEKENYEFDAEIFNIMEERDSRDSSMNNQHHQHLIDIGESNNHDKDGHEYHPTNYPPYPYDMASVPPPGPPPGPPPPGMLFDLSFPPPPPPGYDYSFLPPPPPHDMFSGGVPPPPPPNYMDTKMNTSTSPSEEYAPQPGLRFKLHGSPSSINRAQSH